MKTMGSGTILEFGIDRESELMFRGLTESGGRVSGTHRRGSVPDESVMRPIGSLPSAPSIASASGMATSPVCRVWG
jgi:hypothetical protein